MVGGSDEFVLPRFQGENFSVWKARIEAYLAYGKEGKSPERCAGDGDHGRTLRGGGLVRHRGGGTVQGYECPVALAKRVFFALQQKPLV